MPEHNEPITVAILRNDKPHTGPCFTCGKKMLIASPIGLFTQEGEPICWDCGDKLSPILSMMVKAYFDHLSKKMHAEANTVIANKAYLN